MTKAAGVGIGVSSFPLVVRGDSGTESVYLPDRMVNSEGWEVEDTTSGNDEIYEWRYKFAYKRNDRQTVAKNADVDIPINSHLVVWLNNYRPVNNSTKCRSLPISIGPLQCIPKDPIAWARSWYGDSPIVEKSKEIVSDQLEDRITSQNLSDDSGLEGKGFFNDISYNKSGYDILHEVTYTGSINRSGIAKDISFRTFATLETGNNKKSYLINARTIPDFKSIDRLSEEIFNLSSLQDTAVSDMKEAAVK